VQDCRPLCAAKRGCRYEGRQGGLGFIVAVRRTAAERQSGRRRTLAAIAGVTVAASMPALFRGYFTNRASTKPAGTLQTVRPGYFTVACIGEMPLFGLRDGQPVGTEAEMMRRIVERLGLKLNINIMEWSACLASVPSGRSDCVGGNMAWTEKRTSAMLMTDAIYYTAVFAVMTKDKPFHDKIRISDLTGYRIGTVSGFSFVADLFAVPGAKEVKLYDTTDAAVRDIIARRLDFAFLDAPIIDYMIQQNSAWSLKQVPLAPNGAFHVLGQPQHTLWGMNPGNTPLFDAVNAGIGWLWRTGQIMKILKQYGLTNPAYLQKPLVNLRLGVDRDDQGRVIGPFAHPTADFSSKFA
jgi:polar amino acid transport system substrate-binding protein